MKQGGTPFVWLFDRRFDTLIPSFRRFLERQGWPDPQPITGYRLFPDVGPVGDDGFAPFRQLSPEEVNCRFMEAWDRKALPPECCTDDLPVAAFTQVGLGQREGLHLFGADPEAAETLNRKGLQYRWLSAAGLPLPPYRLFSDGAALRRELPTLLRRYGSVVVQPEVSAGGSGARHLSKPDELEALDTNGRLLVTAFVPDATTLSGHGIVTRQGEILHLWTDQLLLNDFRFDGFIHPPFADAAQLESIRHLTLRAGRVLAVKGYWGCFAVDFLCRQGESPLITEINVRFAGESALLAAFSGLDLFGLLWGDADTPDPALRPMPKGRVAVTKIRPKPGGRYLPPVDESTAAAFARTEAQEFQEGYIDRPVYVEEGHFLGSAGRRFHLQTPEEEINSFYFQARSADISDRSQE